MKQSVIFLFSLLLLTVRLTGQLNNPSSELTQIQFIKGVAGYRESVIHSIRDVMIDFYVLSDSLAMNSINPVMHETFRELFLGKLLKYQGWFIESQVYKIPVSLPLKEWKVYHSWVKANRYSLQELVHMVQSEIIESEEPYKLTNLQDVWEEILFYDLHEGDVFMDVGAGNGIISFILAMTGLPLEIYTTEIDDAFISYLNSKKSRFDPTIFTSDMRLVKAQEKSLGTDSVMADRILMKEVFHHLKHPEEILADVKRHLTADGYLILVEATKDLQKKGDNPCPKAMKKQLILKTLADAGFELIESKIVGRLYLLKFKTNSSI